MPCPTQPPNPVPSTISNVFLHKCVQSNHLYPFIIHPIIKQQKASQPDMKIPVVEEQQQMFEEEEAVVDIHGDLLEITLSFIPLIDLIAASCVSKSWQTAVSSSLTHLRKLKPWLLAHTQINRTSESGPTYSFDPRSNLWLEITESIPLTHSTTVRSSTSDFIYSLSSTTLSVSDDPLHLTWRHFPGPNFHRIDPIVARVGSLIVIAGSAWEFAGDPLAVEVYDTSSSSWQICHSMPMMLKDSAAATWLSVATTATEMFLTEKASGMTYAFDPQSVTGGLWRGPFDLRPDPRVFSMAIGSTTGGGDDGNSLIVAGLIGHPAEGLGIWRVCVREMRCELIAHAPREIVESLTAGYDGLDHHRSIEVAAAEGIVYVYVPAGAETVVWCEYSRSSSGSSESGDGGWDCVWGSTGNLACGDGAKMVGRRVVYTCGMVKMADLRAAMSDRSRKFQAVRSC